MKTQATGITYAVATTDCFGKQVLLQPDFQEVRIDGANLYARTFTTNPECARAFIVRDGADMTIQGYEAGLGSQLYIMNGKVYSQDPKASNYRRLHCTVVGLKRILSVVDADAGDDDPIEFEL